MAFSSSTFKIISFGFTGINILISGSMFLYIFLNWKNMPDEIPNRIENNEIYKESKEIVFVIPSISTFLTLVFSIITLFIPYVIKKINKLTYNRKIILTNILQVVGILINVIIVNVNLMLFIVLYWMINSLTVSILTVIIAVLLLLFLSFLFIFVILIKIVVSGKNELENNKDLNDC